MSSAYLRLLIFLLEILILACASISPAFCMMYSACKLNKQGDSIQFDVLHFPICNQFHKLPTSFGSQDKQESSRKTSTIDYAKAFGSVDHNKLWKILQEMGVPDHLTCLLRNLCAGQEVTWCINIDIYTCVCIYVCIYIHVWMALFVINKKYGNNLSVHPQTNKENTRSYYIAQATIFCIMW